MMKIITFTVFSLICLSFIAGCQSQPAKQTTLKPAPLAVFQHETIWIQTSSLSTSDKSDIQNFNTKLKSRLKMYGANRIETKYTGSSSANGIVIITKINPTSDDATYKLSILRKDRELITHVYPQTIGGEQLAINDFLMSIHHIIKNADSYF